MKHSAAYTTPKPSPCPCKGGKDCQCPHHADKDEGDNDEPPCQPSNSTPAPPKNNKGKERAREDHNSPKAPKQELPSVRKLDLSHLCFSLNFYFLMFLSQFPLCFPY